MDDKFIDALGDLAVGYAAEKWRLSPLFARQIIEKAIKDEIIKPELLQSEFIKYVENVTPYSPPPPPKKKITFFSVVSFIGACFFCLVVYGIFKDVVFAPPPIATRPTATKTLRPHNTATKNRPPTITPVPCFLWSEITPQMQGRQVCVYGVIYQITSSRETYSRYEFSPERNTFFMFTDGFFYHTDTGKNVVAGDCISDTEEVKLIEGVPYMDVGKEIAFCEPWMSGNPPAVVRSTSTSARSAETYSGCPEGCSVHPKNCDIKGNIAFDSGEKIYHLPGQDYYATTTIDPAYGERWFCTEAEALSNGWRKSYQ